ncbi:glutathione S-transferase family protein [Undibacterium sp. SXout11W]|uniref:glutathione S-transferase family protein n=1 Tax=Undibacterium sp. SXout11W TaxID=3413050 RepID=UPI003BF16CCD
MLTLLGKSPSINVRKVQWTCAEIGISFQQEQFGSGTQAVNTPEFMALNPNALVPVIKDGDFVLWESNVICRYLAAKHGRTDLLPLEAQSRARVEQWMDWQATELNNSWRYAFMALVRKSPAHTDQEAIAASIESWNRHMKIFEMQLERTGTYALGAEFTLADIVLGLSVHRWISMPMERPALQAVSAYYERLSLRVAFMQYGRNGLP